MPDATHTDPWIAATFEEIGVPPPPSGDLAVVDPATETVLARVAAADLAACDAAAATACEAFGALRRLPIPERGQLVRTFGDRVRAAKEPLARLVAREMGKCIAEARGEVQEVVDICDFACGLSRSLAGRVLPSERPGHTMLEAWHPLGPVLCITAFNFPVAVFAWNAAIGWVCGDSFVWKPSLHTPLSAYALAGLAAPVFEEAGVFGAVTVAVAPPTPGTLALVEDDRFPLVSATGSCAMGRVVAPKVAARLGRTILELGGNNAAIIDETADLDLAVRAVVFGAVGTAGQRCTTTRRLYVHASRYDEVLARLRAAYEQVIERIGDPLDEKILVGPLVDGRAVERFETAVATARAQGGSVVVGGRRRPGPGHFVEPTLVAVPGGGIDIMAEETFAPILYVAPVADLDEAIAANNAVEQGLSSALFTRDVGAMGRFLSAEGSDCGIANVNTGTSGAEVGGAFGGEKATGGGREAGSDAWKAYMRRQTCVVNASGTLPLAQGIDWGVAGDPP
ncbi:MAG: aldehyde dehydrogenase family protein [Deltaproteobacteria bacterium]|nr:MAG: aldehyde dehydrogenase family protein [Deltaproteobacteria bacterium]